MFTSHKNIINFIKHSYSSRQASFFENMINNLRKNPLRCSKKQRLSLVSLVIEWENWDTNAGCYYFSLWSDDCCLAVWPWTVFLVKWGKVIKFPCLLLMLNKNWLNIKQSHINCVGRKILFVLVLYSTLLVYNFQYIYCFMLIDELSKRTFIPSNDN